ncbi:MAG: energy transducer TonB [Candidatus Obscuribacterales bacterium]|jgi:hypothetical protein|nr:energy transducer TonB [Candidatus Obscuribacterales bacterium]
MVLLTLKVHNLSVCTFAFLIVLSLSASAVIRPALASDWEEDGKPTTPVPVQQKTEPRRIKRTPAPEQETGAIEPFSGIGTNDSYGSQESNDRFGSKGSNDAYGSKNANDNFGSKNLSSGSGAPLQGKIEKTGSKIGQELKPMDAQAGSTDPLSGRAIDNELRGMVNDGSLKGLSPTMGDLGAPLKGRAALEGGKGSTMDPDEEDQELMVEWDRWHNRFLRAVQLGVQELLNNPDPEDYERPRVDPRTGNFTSRYPLGTGAAFSCQVTAEGQIKNLEIIETSGFPKYDKAVVRAVQQLAGTRILVFPKGSHRRTVIQPGRIKTATTNDFKYHHFGDVERIRGR